MEEQSLPVPDNVHRSKKGLIICLAIILGLLVLGTAGYVGYKKWQKSKQIIPLAIKAQLSYPIFWPTKSSPIKTDKATINYEPSNKLFTFKSTTTEGTILIFSQQPTPESFNDIPQAYDKLVESLLQYSSFDTVNGKVYLTHPKELSGGQSAVMNTKGTLMFVKPSKDLNDDTWKQIFNNLDIIK